MMVRVSVKQINYQTRKRGRTYSLSYPFSWIRNFIFIKVCTKTLSTKRKLYFCFSNFCRSAISLHHFEKHIRLKKKRKMEAFRYYLFFFILPTSHFELQQVKGDTCKKVWQLFQKLVGLDKKKSEQSSNLCGRSCYTCITCRSLCQDKFCIIPIYNAHVLNIKEATLPTEQ